MIHKQKKKFLMGIWTLLTMIAISSFASAAIVGTDFQTTAHYDGVEILNATEVFPFRAPFQNTYQPFEQKINVFGYSLEVIAEIPFIWDQSEESYVVITSTSLNVVDVEVKTEFELRKFSKLEMKLLVQEDLSGKTIFRYEIHANRLGFFMDLTYYEESSVINIAYDSDQQFIYQGIGDQGIKDDIPYLVDKFDKYLVSKINTEKAVSSPIDLETLKLDLKQRQRTNTRISKNFDDPEPSRDFIYEFTFGFVHEVKTNQYVVLPPDIFDDYWDDYTEIQYGIYREEPSESTICSDLQFYNKDVEDMVKQDILAYTIYADGSSSAGYDTWWWMDDGGGWLTPTEVGNLWYDYDVYDVYCHDMVVLANVCYGYSRTSSSEEYMAKQFVDANKGDGMAFVGAAGVIIPIGAATDIIADAFWETLCQNDGTVEDAATAYADAKPWSYYWGWYTYGDEIKLYGNEDGYLE